MHQLVGTSTEPVRLAPCEGPMWYLMGIRVVPISRFQREQDKGRLHN